jgi:predicted HTH domain antitoxin
MSDVATRTITVELPEEILDLLCAPEHTQERVREAFVLDLLRDGIISQGRAAELLNVSRWELINLMAKHQIPSGPRTAEEVRAEIETAERLARQ